MIASAIAPGSSSNFMLERADERLPLSVHDPAWSGSYSGRLRPAPSSTITRAPRPPGPQRWCDYESDNALRRLLDTEHEARPDPPPGGLGDLNVSAIEHASPIFFLPSVPLPLDVLSRLAYHNQHPEQPACTNSKFLLVEDNLVGAGFGYTTHLMALSLSLAMREGRVLVEVPSIRPRWCSHQPYTFQCYYQNWTDCPPPSYADVRSAARWMAEGNHSAARFARLELSRFENFELPHPYGAVSYTHLTLPTILLV